MTLGIGHLLILASVIAFGLAAAGVSGRLTAVGLALFAAGHLV